MKLSMEKARIDFEITSEHVPYEYTDKLIKKICGEYEQKRDLHIKVNLIGTYLLESESSKDASAS